MNLDSTEDRKGISTIEQQLRQKIYQLEFEVDKLKSDLRYKERLINELKALKGV